MTKNLPIAINGELDASVLVPAKIADKGYVEDILSAIEEIANSYVVDLSTAASRKAAKSQAYTIARSKTALDEAAQDLTKAWRDKTSAVNATRKIIKDRLDSAADKIRKPVEEFEKAEAIRIREIEVKITRLRELSLMTPALQSKEQLIYIKDVELLELQSFDFEEKSEMASQHINALLTHLPKMIAEKEQQEEAARAEAARLAEEERVATEQRQKEAEERQRLQYEKRELEKKVAEHERKAKEAEEKIARHEEVKARTEEYLNRLNSATSEMDLVDLEILIEGLDLSDTSLIAAHGLYDQGQRALAHLSEVLGQKCDIMRREEKDSLSALQSCLDRGSIQDAKDALLSTDPQGFDFFRGDAEEIIDALGKKVATHNKEVAKKYRSANIKTLAADIAQVIRESKDDDSASILIATQLIDGRIKIPQ